MTIAYFDAFSGASGDMIVGALLAAGADLEVLKRDLAVLDLHGVEVSLRRVERQGITASKFDVAVHGHVEGPADAHHHHDHPHDPHHGHDDHPHHHDEAPHPHEHRTLADVEAKLAPLPEPARTQAVAIFRRLAEAEAKVHGTTASFVHFHEVGMDDAIVDVAAAVLCLRQLGVTEVQCSPLPTGSGFVRCAHGMMPVPVPAVVELLQGVPAYDNGEKGELVTPTGAAILTTLATRFGPMPAMALGPVGYGAGGREGQRLPNLLRVMLGQPAEAQEPTLVELQANIDDMSPQFYGPLVDQLLGAGALDVTLTPTVMKKGRPGIVLAVLAPGERLDALGELLFRETTTLGLRYHPVYRRMLDREVRSVATRWGAVDVKLGSLHGEVLNVAPEFEDCRRVAEAAGAPLKAVWQEALAVARRELTSERP
ncbi:MAG: hypothetical protein JWM80_2988 [Cyanobacteria bacterium RYN_339]|nr:hypothetical protein [Cyanobacteria bacterium RYN_339]